MTEARKGGDVAKVTITFEDLSEGGMNIKIESDPPLPGPAAPKSDWKKLTQAQHVGLQLMRALSTDVDEAYKGGRDEGQDS